MQVGTNLATVRSFVAKSVSMPSTIDVMIGSLAQSTQLSLAEKRDFARALMAAAGDPVKLKAILMAMLKLESERKPGSYPPNTVAEVMQGLQGDSAANMPSGLFA